jgi:hypothetical protein
VEEAQAVKASINQKKKGDEEHSSFAPVSESLAGCACNKQGKLKNHLPKPWAATVWIGTKCPR